MKITFKDGITVEVKDTKNKSKKEILDVAKKLRKEIKDNKIVTYSINNDDPRMEDFKQYENDYNIECKLVYDGREFGEYSFVWEVSGKEEDILDFINEYCLDEVATKITDSKSVKDEVSYNWKELIEGKPFKYEDSETIIIDCNNNGEYDLVIGIDNSYAYDSIEYHYQPQKISRYPEDSYPADEEFLWDEKLLKFNYCSLNGKEINLSEEDKKEIFELLFGKNANIDIYTKYDQMMYDMYMDELERKAEEYEDDKEYYQEMEWRARRDAGLEDSKTVKDYNDKDLAAIWLASNFKELFKLVFEEKYDTNEFKKLKKEAFNKLKEKYNITGEDANKVMKSAASVYNKLFKDSKSVKDSKKVKDSCSHIIETEHDPTYAVRAEYDEWTSDYSDTVLDEDEIYSYEPNMICSFDELIETLFNEITDDTIRIDVLKEYYDTDFENHKDELVYELKSEPGKYYTLEEIDEDYQGVPLSYNKYYVEEH